MLSDGLQGVCAALGAPLVSCVGVLLWDKYWTGSAVRKTHALRVHNKKQGRMLNLRCVSLPKGQLQSLRGL